MDWKINTCATILFAVLFIFEEATGLKNIVAGTALITSIKVAFDFYTGGNSK